MPGTNKRIYITVGFYLLCCVNLYSSFRLRPKLNFNFQPLMR